MEMLEWKELKDSMISHEKTLPPQQLSFSSNPETKQ